MTDATVSPEGVRAAARRLAGVAIRTPLIEHAELNERTGGRIFLKLETLQHGGSFKFRGAWNRLTQLSDEEKRCGVLAWSSGNHAYGVALAARRLGIPATIVMPSDAPQVKTEQVRAAGAEIVPFDRYKDDREAIGRRIAEARGLALAPSYDHVQIIEGQGTLALEAVEQAVVDVDAFVICCGGGGLAAGCATILEEIAPKSGVILAEPEHYDEFWRSIRAGERFRNDITRKTLCDAIATPSPGELTFPILRRRATGGATVTETDIGAAIAFAFKRLKLVVEPGGAAALAAVLAGKVETRGRCIVVTISGGNVDAVLFRDMLARHA